MTRTIRIDDDIYESLKKLADPFEDTPNSVIRKLLYQSQSPIKLEKEVERPSGKITRGNLTPQSVYEEWLIYTLWDEFKGRAKKGEITEATILNMQRRSLLKDADLGKVSTGETRAANTLAWARNRLKDKGLINPDSPTGFWELTEEGIKRAQKIEITKINQPHRVIQPRKIDEINKKGEKLVINNRRNGVLASGYLLDNRRFTVLTGSTLSKKTAPKFQTSAAGAFKLRARYYNDGTINANHQLTRDVIFHSISQAASFILGDSKNGNKEWIKE